MFAFIIRLPYPFSIASIEYQTVRQDSATLTSAKMLELNATSSNQPCEKFGLHDDLSVLKNAYDSGDAVFFANTGHLSKPVTKDNWFTETQAQLFSHFSMTEEAEYVDAFREEVGTGVLGRMLDVLQLQNYSVSPNAINSNSGILSGNPQLSRSVDVISAWGLDEFYARSTSDTLSTEAMKSTFQNLNGEIDSESGMYAEQWAQSFVDAVDKNSKIGDALDGVTVSETFDEGSSGRSFEMVAKLMRAREERRVNRDAFAISLYGWDTHADMKNLVDALFVDLNGALDSFTKEIEAAGLSDNVTVVIASEFARVSLLVVLCIR